MNANFQPRSDGRGSALRWTALGGSALAVLAWAACCVLPLALSLTSVGLAGVALIAGQRTWLTAVAALIVAAGWWTTWRRSRACSTDPNCAPPSRLSVVVLMIATVLIALALVWQPVIEPWALRILRSPS